MKSATKSRSFGRYGITTRAINGYKEKVKDPNSRRYSRKDVIKIIRRALNNAGTPILSDPVRGDVYEVNFNVKGKGPIGPYYLILRADRYTHGNSFNVTTLLIENPTTRNLEDRVSEQT